MNKDYGTHAPAKIAEALVNGTRASTHNASTDGHTVKINGLTVAEKKDDGTLCLTNAGYVTPMTVRYLERIMAEYTGKAWHGHHAFNGQTVLEAMQAKGKDVFVTDSVTVGSHLKPVLRWKQRGRAAPGALLRQAA